MVYTTLLYLVLLSIALSLFAMFTCMKRGGLIAAILGVTVYYLVDYLFAAKGKNKLLSIVVILVLISGIIVGFLRYDAITDNQFTGRLQNIQEDGGSGRIEVWAESIRLITTSDTKGLLLGHGHLKVIEDSIFEISAHNDFLEILYNYGIFGFLLYCSLHWALIRLTIYLIRQKSSYAAPMAMSYVIFFILTMISHIYFYPYFVFLLLFWGKVLGAIARERQTQLPL